MFKFKKMVQNNNVVRVMAIVLTVAMLMTVCMTEAFAALAPGTEVMPCASGTVGGYNVSANMSFTSVYNKVSCSTLSDVNAGVSVISGNAYYYVTGSASPLCRYMQPTSAYYGYNLSFSVTVKEVATHYQPSHGQGRVQFGYNGQSTNVVVNFTA